MSYHTHWEDERAEMVQDMQAAQEREERYRDFIHGIQHLLTGDDKERAAKLLGPQDETWIEQCERHIRRDVQNFRHAIEMEMARRYAPPPPTGLDDDVPF